jgi:predicted ABC-class ATPase
LPFGKDTLRFKTDNASGSTSQAANIIEAIEAGAKLLLLDEDTSATNFMIRDARMQRLVAANREPITPFIDRARQLFEIFGVSTVLVMGGSGDYFDIADRVVLMDHYRPQDVTSKAREIAGELPSQRVPAESELPKISNARIPLPESFNPMIGKKVTVRSRGKDSIQFGRTTIDLTYVEQIAEESQTRAIGSLLLYAVRNGIIDGKRSVPEIVKTLEEHIDAEGLEVASPFARPSADCARPRSEEICAAINRLRTLVVR